MSPGDRPSWLARARCWLALGSILLFPACGGAGSSTTPTPSSPALAAPLVEGKVLDARRYALDLHLYAGSPVTLRVTFRIPDGWEAWKYGVVDTEGGGEPPAGRGVGFWIVDEVYADPCRWNRGWIDPAVGSSVLDLVAALAEQRQRYATTPRDVTLAGYPGKQMQLQVPPTIDFSDCWHSEFHSWTALPSGGRYHQGPGQYDRLWIVDVDGVRLVIRAAFFPKTSPEDRAELLQIVESVRIE
ncbi:MAG: hypothetical protein WEE66_05645 [Actinomycetota bacterium]